MVIMAAKLIIARENIEEIFSFFIIHFSFFIFNYLESRSLSVIVFLPEVIKQYR